MEKIAVPSILSHEGLTDDSFSMCFGNDGTGWISFGDKGSPDQEETPFNVNPSHCDLSCNPTYNITATQIQFHSQDSRHSTDSRIPFEYCYDMSPNANTSLIPSMSLTMKGGSHFPMYDPIIVISTQSKFVYCLAVFKSTELNIIGQNSMTGYRVVFDRERFVLGWKKSDCYEVEESNTSEEE